MIENGRPRGAASAPVQVEYPFVSARGENTHLGHAFAVRWVGGERAGGVLAVWEVSQPKASFVLESLDGVVPADADGVNKSEL